MIARAVYHWDKRNRVGISNNGLDSEFTPSNSFQVFFGLSFFLFASSKKSPFNIQHSIRYFFRDNHVFGFPNVVASTIVSFLLRGRIGFESPLGLSFLTIDW